ncbi:hypothetical protein [Sphingomonas corticis]|uniref:Uncharacterized protein n=1 Tax=Sphingomonas corticis TaxID=2722791 RepID=A0ABX1CRY1_9SPHN|nr:hypothetical protein [Sphingomonas corticis]NJR80056.1 hypothetical protein [Sphingomonas corticis]
MSRAVRACSLTVPPTRAPGWWNPTPSDAPCRERAFAFARRCGKAVLGVQSAILDGFLAGEVSGGGGHLAWTVFLNHPEETADEIVDRLLCSASEFADGRELRWACKNLKRLHRLEPIPEEIIEAYARLPDAFEGDTHESEINAVMLCSRPEAFRVGRSVAQLRSGVARTRRLPPIEGDVRKALISGLAPDVPELVGTCLERQVGLHLPAPTPEYAARLLSIETGYRSFAIASCCDALANAFLVKENEISLAHCRMAIVLAGAKMGDHREIRRRIKAYLSGRILRLVPPWCRIYDVYEWVASERRARLWAEERSTPVQLREWLEENMPEVPRDRGFMKMLERHHDRLRDGATARRRVSADYIADNFDSMLAEMEGVAEDCGTIYRAARDTHAVASHEDLDEIRISIPLPVRKVPADVGQEFLLDVRSVRVRTQLERVEQAIPKELWRSEDDFLASALTGTRRGSDVLHHERVLVIGRCELRSAIAANPSLAFLEPYLVGATLRPRYLSDELLAERRAYLAATGLPPPHLAAPNVLTGDSSEHRRLMALSLVHTDEVIIPAAALYRGVAMGRLAFRTICLAHVRITTARQIIHDPVRGWVTLNDMPAFLAVPKLPHKLRMLPRRDKLRAFPLDGLTMKAFQELVALTIELDGGDPEHPRRLRIVPNACSSPLPSDCGPDRYVFQVAGRLQDISQVQYTLSFPFRRRIKPHDARAGSATKRFDEGDTLENIGTAMGTGMRRIGPYVTRGKGAKRPGNGRRWIDARDAIAGLGNPKGRR